ncbi:hypothetical protein DID88_006509 [Monilinia fructigena]|uniref:Uncharacterized protein n=1 Tax=Monilinia fructigena TaxID=38457 RepID=A0A395IGP3_9HELO|nr:hypothetical protein DID88_006509 [Monilinia fructigena]
MYRGIRHSRIRVTEPIQPDTSHSIEVRRQNKTLGLVPPSVESYALQAQRCLKQLEAKKSPIEKYMYLSNLRNNNVHLFYRLVQENWTDITPLILYADSWRSLFKMVGNLSTARRSISLLP